MHGNVNAEIAPFESDLTNSNSFVSKPDRKLFVRRVVVLMQHRVSPPLDVRRGNNRNKPVFLQVIQAAMSIFKRLDKAPFDRGGGHGIKLRLDTHLLPLTRYNIPVCDDVGFFDTQRVYVSNDGADILYVVGMLNNDDQILASELLDSVGPRAKCGL